MTPYEDLTTPIWQILDDAGIDASFLVKKLKAELNAKEIRFFQYQGRIISTKKVVAWDIRQKARQDAHKIRGDYAPEKQEIQGNVTLLAPAEIKKPKKSGKAAK